MARKAQQRLELHCSSCYTDTRKDKRALERFATRQAPLREERGKGVGHEQVPGIRGTRDHAEACGQVKNWTPISWIVSTTSSLVHFWTASDVSPGSSAQWTCWAWKPSLIFPRYFRAADLESLRLADTRNTQTFGKSCRYLWYHNKQHIYVYFMSFCGASWGRDFFLFCHNQSIGEQMPFHKLKSCIDAAWLQYITIEITLWSAVWIILTGPKYTKNAVQ